MWLSVVAVILGFMLFALAGVYTVRQQEHVNKRLCQGTVQNRQAVRTTWMAAHKLLLEAQDTEEGRQAIDRLFDGILEVIPPLRCVDSNPIPKEG